MADWDEVKRLAADFQKVQLSSTTQRLSERNCIEIITWLIQKKVIDLIFTTDGKEYMTSAQLVSEIYGELYINGGRVNYADLVKSIGVDLNHITSHINEVLKQHKDVHAILGQLIDNLYIVRIAEEINEKLTEQGQININDLTIQYDLPADFLQHQVLEKNLGKIIFGKQDSTDPRVFFTESFVNRTKAKINGALAGITMPTPISAIISNLGITEKLFFSLFDKVCTFGTLTNRMTGAQYVPNIYSRTQNEWVNNFYKQNLYLEYDALNRLGISDCKNYLKKQLANEPLFFLDSCAISKSMLLRVEVDLEECISSKSFLDVHNSLPSVFNDKDIKMILDLILIGQKQKDTIFMGAYVFSKAYADSLIETCEEALQQKVKQVVESGQYQQYQTQMSISSNKLQKQGLDVEDIKHDKREERRKKATGGKTGGGTQGRETKTKSTKKLYRTKVVEDDDDDEGTVDKRMTLEIITTNEISKIIGGKLEDEGLDEVIDDFSNYVHSNLNQRGLEAAAILYETTVSDKTANRRNIHNEVQNKVNCLLGDIRLFEKGLKLLSADLQTQLYKYLLKTLCTDCVNEILSYISTEIGGQVADPSSFTHEQRTKFVNELPTEYKGPLQALMKAVTSTNLESFFTTADEALAVCSMIVKKIDKKKDRVIVLNHKHELLDQLNKCDDPALVLHLTVLVIFVSATQTMVHASGRHVAAIMAFLKQYLTEDQASELSTYHDMVTLMLSGGAEAENLKEKLIEIMPTIKMIANEYKKPSQ